MLSTETRTALLSLIDTGNGGRGITDQGLAIAIEVRVIQSGLESLLKRAQRLLCDGNAPAASVLAYAVMEEHLEHWQHKRQRRKVGTELAQCLSRLLANRGNPSPSTESVSQLLQGVNDFLLRFPLT